MLWQKNYTTCTMHAVSLSYLSDFSFSWKFSRKFCEIIAKILNFRENENCRNSRKFAKFAKIVPLSQDFCIFAKIENCIFVSTLVRIQLWIWIRIRIQKIRWKTISFSNTNRIIKFNEKIHHFYTNYIA
jgi:hypothetical protein